MNAFPPIFLSCASLLWVLCSGLGAAPAAPVVWWDGSRSTTPPAGKLLSDNAGFWGEQIETGVRYWYEAEANQPADAPALSDTGRGRLLDGIPTGDLKTTVGAAGAELSVVFDLQKPYVITEVDLSAHSIASSALVEVRDGPDADWAAAEATVTRGQNAGFFRLLFTHPQHARYLRVRLKADEGALHRLSEVWIWGDEKLGKSVARAAKTRENLPPASTKRSSFPGVKKSTFSQTQLENWQKRHPEAGDIVWSKYGEINGPWLPSNRVASLRLLSLRGGTASAALVLTAKSGAVQGSTLSITPFTPQEAVAPELRAPRLSVAGVVKTRRWGATPRPLFHPSNRLPGHLLERYLLNAPQVAAFPRVELGEGESLLVHLHFEVGATQPGVYKAGLVLDGLGTTLPIELEVLDAELPTPRVWVNSWSGLTPSMPFHTGERLQNEVAYKKQLGITVWNDGLPFPGTLSEAVRQQDPDLVYLLRLPRKIVDAGWKGEISKAGLSAADRALVQEHLQLLRQQVADLGLAQERWFLELWDEPRARNVEGFQAVAELVKSIDPAMPLYANPCFWINMEKGFSTDEEVHKALSPWYEKDIAISVVQIGLENRERFPQTFELFDKGKYSVRAVYQHPSPNRKAVWEVFQRGWNGWGFYSYARPRGNPWDDFDGTEFDFQFVYPGPNGPIPTLESEAFRACWEDYRLLTLLKQRGMDAELAALYEKLPLCLDDAAIESLREQALQMLKTALKAPPSL